MGHASRFLGGALVCLSILAASTLAQTVGQSASPTIAEVPVGEGAGGPAVLRRLTAAQYRNIVADVFGDTITLGGRFEPDLRVDHLVAIGAGQSSVTAAGLEQYDRIARAIGDQVTGSQHRRQMLECAPASATAPDDGCTGRFLARVGRLLLRRPLSAGQLQTYVAAAAAVTRTTGDYYSGVALALSGVLVSPHFLYRTELIEPDAEHPGRSRLDAYAKAQRLSFLLWNTAPDSALLTAAETGELHTSEGLARQVDRLLASPRLEDGVRAMFADMFQFDTFDTLAKDATLYPKFTFVAAAQAPEQTLRTLIQLLVTENGDYRDIFTTRKTFLTPLLGSLYRVPVVAPDGLPNAWVPYEFPAASGQSGILTHASFVALHSHPGRSSPTLRGRALREIFLCTNVPDPPGDVDFSGFEDPTGPSRTARERLDVHRANPGCAACHKMTDPIGLALETFDTVGGPRRVENGVTIDTSGDLDGAPFADAIGLGRAVHDHPRAAACMVRRTFDYALGRRTTRSEAEWRASYLEKQFAADGYRVPALLRHIAMSDVYYRVVPSETDAKAPAAGATKGATLPEARQ